MGVFGNIA